MTKQKLLQRLALIPDEAEIMILDGSNGGGFPREINFGPVNHVITAEDADENADCEDRVGEPVIVIGYGCY